MSLYLGDNLIAGAPIDAANRDGTNITDIFKSAIASYPMPSNTYVDLTLGASGASYTAPADGWYYYGADSAGCQISNETRKLATVSNYVQNLTGCNAYIPANKGDIIYLYYNGTSNSQFRFIYANGSESEAQ